MTMQLPPRIGALARKDCCRCRESKPLDFDHWYRDASSYDGYQGVCRSCVNAQPKAQTTERLARSRARHRAAAALIELHREEFEQLYADCRAEALEEADRLAADPELQVIFDGKPPRLRHGPKGRGEPSDPRVDTDWCAKCAVFHALDHHLKVATNQGYLEAARERVS